MRRAKYGDTQIVSILNKAEADMPVKEICRKFSISLACYYQWKAKFGGLGVAEIKRLKELGSENSKLKRPYADMALPAH